MATSFENIDDDLEKEVIDGVEFFRGSPENPAKRILDAAETYGLDYVVRVTGDSPLISYELLDQLIASHISNEADYSYIENAPLGLKSEVFNTSALQKLFDNLETEKYSEYLTLYFKNNPDVFSINAFTIVNKDIVRYKDARFNLDYEDDYAMLEKFFNKADSQDAIGLTDIVNILEQEPEIININSHIIPKYFSDKSLSQKLKEGTRST